MEKQYVVDSNAVYALPGSQFAELISAVLTKDARFRFQANGSSMFPFIRDGDVIMLAPKPARLRFGDVAAFVNPANGRLTVHRVIGWRDDCYLMRGDNCPEPDGYFPHTVMLGRVVRVERRGQPVRVGLGAERAMIALLSRYNRLASLLVSIRYIFRIFIKR